MASIFQIHRSMYLFEMDEVCLIHTSLIYRSFLQPITSYKDVETSAVLCQWNFNFGNAELLIENRSLGVSRNKVRCTIWIIMYSIVDDISTMVYS